VLTERLGGTPVETGPAIDSERAVAATHTVQSINEDLDVVCCSLANPFYLGPPATNAPSTLDLFGKVGVVGGQDGADILRLKKVFPLSLMTSAWSIEGLAGKKFRYEH
jgi:hypothetical protein